MSDVVKTGIKGRKLGLDSIISKLKESAPERACDKPSSTAQEEESKENVDSGPETDFVQKKSKRKSGVKVRYRRQVMSDEDVASGSEIAVEPLEESPVLTPNGALQEPDEKMISVIHTSQIKVEPVVDSDYENTLEGFEKMTGLTVGDVEKNEDEGNTKHKGSKHKHHRHHKKSNDVLEDEDGLPRRVDCTACGRQVNPKHGTISRHPFLHVLVCKKCIRYYNSGPFTRDEFGIDEQCRWCGDGGALICCDNCAKAFCKPCIRRNLGRSFMKALTEAPDDQEWKCFCCDPSPLAELVKKAHVVMGILEVQKAKKGLFKSKNETSLTSGPKQQERRKRLASLSEDITVKTDGILSPGVSPVKKTFSPNIEKQESDNAELEEEESNHNVEEKSNLVSRETSKSKKKRKNDDAVVNVDDDDNDSVDNDDSEGEVDSDEIASEVVTVGNSGQKKNRCVKSYQKTSVKDRINVSTDDSGDDFDNQKTKRSGKSQNNKNRTSKKKVKPSDSSVSELSENSERKSNVNKGKSKTVAKGSESDKWSDSDDDVTLISEITSRGRTKGKSRTKQLSSDELSENESDSAKIVNSKSKRNKKIKRKNSSESDINNKKGGKGNQKRNNKSKQQKKASNQESSSDSESDRFSDFVSMVNLGYKDKEVGKRRRKEKIRDSDEVDSLSEKEQRDTKHKRKSRRKRVNDSNSSMKQAKKNRRKKVSSGDESSESVAQRKTSKKNRVLSEKKTRKRKRQVSSSSNSDESEDSESELESVSRRTRRQKKRRTSEVTTDSDSQSDSSDIGKRRRKRKQTGKKSKGKGRKKKRNRLDSEDSDSVEESSPTKRKKGRKDIRKVLDEDKLAEETKRARKLEEERRKRLLERTQQVYEEETFPGESSLTAKLVLEADPETKEPIVEVKKDILQYLKPHQVKGVKFLYDCTIESVKSWKKKDPGGGCILAHCMGLGKTLQVVALIHTVHNHKDIGMKTSLVVAPLNTVLNWQVEFEKWLGVDDRLEVYVLTEAGSSNWRRADMLKQWHRYGGVMIMGYDAYRNLSQGSRVRSKHQKKIFKESLVDPGPDMVVCDEGHILRNDSTAIAKALNAINTKRRVVLTGTPLQNNLIEYHCMVSFVKPNLLGTRKEFQNSFANPIQNGQCADSTPGDVKLMKQRCHVLHKMLEGCVQRMDYSELTPFLPPKHEYVISVRLSSKQRKLYRHYLDTFVYADGDVTKRGLGLFSDYQALMRIWTHPWTMKLEALRRPERFADTDSLEDFVVHSDEESEESENSNTSDDDKLVLSDSESDFGGRRHGRGKTRSQRKQDITSSSESNDDDDDGDDSDDDGDNNSDEEEAAPPVSRRSAAKQSAQAVNGTDRAGSSKQEDDITVVEVGSSLSGPNGVTKAGAFGSTRSGADFKGGIEEVIIEEEKEWYDEFLSEDDESNIELSGKLVLLLEILADAEAVGEKVLVFSQSLVTLDLIEKALGGGEVNGDRENWCRGCDYFRMDGSTSAHLRQRWSDIFNDTDNTSARLFLISTKAGGLGINLVAANRVVVFDASWNPSHDVQSIFRVYRFGQLKPVYIYRFLAQGTMEEKIYERQITKLSISQRVVDEHQIERHFTANDLAELYAFTAEEYEEPEQHPTESTNNTADQNGTNPDSQQEESLEVTTAKEDGETSASSKNKDDEKEVKDGGKGDESKIEGSCMGDKDATASVQQSEDSHKSTTNSLQQRPSLPLPKDAVLADLINRLHPKWIVKYHVHDSLLVNIEEETLTEEEMKAAWDAYEAEKNNVKTLPAAVTVSQAQQFTQYPLPQQPQQYNPNMRQQETSAQLNAESAARASFNVRMIQQMHQIKLQQEWEREQQRRQQAQQMERMRLESQNSEQLRQRVLTEMRREEERRRENHMRMLQNQTAATATPRLPIPSYQPAYRFITTPQSSIRGRPPNLVSVLSSVPMPQISVARTGETRPNTTRPQQIIRINVDKKT